MTVIDLAAAGAGLAFFGFCWLGLRWAEAPRTGSTWSSSTYGDADRAAAAQGPELSALDVLDGRSTWLVGKYDTPPAGRTSNNPFVTSTR